MPKAIWDGRGDADGTVYFTKNNGELVGRPYLRRRVASHLARWSWRFPLDARRAALAATVGDDDWLRGRTGELVASVCRAAEEHLLFMSLPDQPASPPRIQPEDTP